MKLCLAMQDGMAATLLIFFSTLLFSIPLGMVVALLRMHKSRVISWPVSLYILVMRGTPLMLQIFAIYFAIPMLTGLNLDRMAATILAFSLNYAAYFAEIFRGGMMSIPVGQHEACEVLGLTKLQAFFHIILPQVAKRVLLPVSNEVITLVKDTSLANIIAVGELFRAAKNEASRTASVEPLFVAGLFYLLMNGVVTLFFSQLTRRMAYYKD
ncbi:MAG: amino acid ABC transporter permease [Clostridia bacterium]|nr:amino acid ABC transporter permease [Clostridia bacterium]MBQ2947964.1 amino acid ABC transporter permease [Clostridia bacterium]MBQ4609305.1 amino acid ABC transporter permease [Clostridia bacterium]MBQ6858150.1 amino acid ABC transporter permease [Clostridia bacterium]